MPFQKGCPYRKPTRKPDSKWGQPPLPEGQARSHVLCVRVQPQIAEWIKQQPDLHYRLVLRAYQERRV